MPKSLEYPDILHLVTSARIGGFGILLTSKNPVEDYHKYGAYLWSQKVSGAIYPIIQHLEVVLRNSIDQEARNRFGDYWWRTITVDTTRPNHNNFKNGMDLAEGKLKKEWNKKERVRLGISNTAPLPLGTVVPIFTHDQIVAATDFGTWKEVLVSAFHTSNTQQMQDYLWPKSMANVFRRFNVFSASPDVAREQILNLLEEIKDYRNRLFHHDCIWVKVGTSNQLQAIQTIRRKINLMEKLIKAVSPATQNALTKWNIFQAARAVCTVEFLESQIEP
jgi:hypothetical protein